VTSNRKQLAIDAMQKALALRKKQGYSFHVPICIFDFVKKIGIDVRFVCIPTLEGIYSNDPLTIIISSLRPAGRQKYTCAHELGHHIYQHGYKIDEIGQKNVVETNEQEFLVDCFAGFLLMPQVCIQNAFKIRNWDYSKPEPLQIYVISNYLGVGYSTLINHMYWSLHLFSSSLAKELLKNTPKQIKERILNYAYSQDVFVVDKFWTDRAIDLSVGDLIATGKDIEIDGANIKIIEDDTKYKIIKACTSGISRIYSKNSDWAAFVRISNKDFEGLSEYRHFEEVD
jgi:Zn-dependent peptidase ImmA (M78 family)